MLYPVVWTETGPFNVEITFHQVNGFVYVGAKPFKIDHPFDPENKCLHHIAVESPEMKNFYDGIVFLDEQGEASVDLPRLFEALNTDFRYQLTSLGVSMPGLFVAGEIEDDRLKLPVVWRGRE